MVETKHEKGEEYYARDGDGCPSALAAFFETGDGAVGRCADCGKLVKKIERKVTFRSPKYVDGKRVEPLQVVDTPKYDPYTALEVKKLVYDIKHLKGGE